jgi:hypothetical protein
MGARKKMEEHADHLEHINLQQFGGNKEKHDIQQLEHILFEMETHENKKLTASARSIFQKKGAFFSG